MAEQTGKEVRIPKTDAELKQIAVDIFENKIFTNRHIAQEDMKLVSSLFMPIALGAFSSWTEEELQDIGLIYEYMTEAAPRNVNGYPSFFSMQILSNEENRRMVVFYKEYSALKEGFVNG